MFKTSAKCLGILAILAIAALFCLPWFFSTSAGKGILVKAFSKKSGYTIEIGDLSLSWLGPQSAKNIHAQNARDKRVVTCQEATTDASLWSLFKKDVGHLKLASPYLQTARAFAPMIAQVPKEFLRKTSVKAAALGAMPGIELANIPLKGHIVVEKGKVELDPPGLEPIRFDGIALSLDRLEKEEIALALSCQTSQQGSLGNIAIKGSASALSSSFPNIVLQLSASELPVLGIDQLASLFAPRLNGLIYAAIGPKITMQCNLASAKGNFDLYLNAQSPQMSVQIATQTEGDRVSLKNPATFNFNLTPLLLQKFVNAFPSLKPLVLTTAAPIEGTLSQFSCPMPTRIEDLLACSFQAKMGAQAPLSLILNGQPFVLNGLIFAAQSSQLQKDIALSLNASLPAGGVAIEGHIQAPFSHAPEGTLSINADKLPTDLLAIASGSSIALSTFVGQTVNIKGSAALNQGTPKLHLSWQSPFLNVPSLDLSLAEPLTLTAPAKFTLMLNPAAFPGIPFKAGPIEGTLQTLILPSDIKNTHTHATLNTSALSFSGEFPLTLSKMQADLQINTLDQMVLSIKGIPLEVFVSGAFKPKTSEFVLNKPLFVAYTLDETSPLAALPNLAKPATVQLSIDPCALPISGVSLRRVSLKGRLSSSEVALGSQQTQVVMLQKLNIPFQWDAGSKTAKAELQAQVQNPSGAAGSMQGQFTLSNFVFKEGLDFNRAEIVGTLDLQNLSSGLLDAFYRNGPLSAIIGSNFSTKLKLQSTVDKQTMGIKWTSPNLNIDSAFVIDHSSVQLQGGANQLTWILTPESYKVLDRIITGTTPLSFRGTEQREIDMISSKKKNKPKDSAPVPAPRPSAKPPQPSPFEISEQTTFIIALSKLSLPVASPRSRIPDIVFDLAKLQLSATGKNTKLSFFDKATKETVQLSNIAFAVNKAADLGPLTASFDSGVVTLSGSATAPGSVKNGSISFDGKLLQAPNTTGNFDLNQLTCSLQMKIQQLPSRALDLFARAKGRTDFPFSTAFGDMINATAGFELKNASGPFSVNINTPRTRLDIEGNLANGAVLLKNTLHAQLTVTPELSRLVLREVNPLNLSYFYARDPITLEIPATGFYLPLYPFDLSKINILKAKIELGKIGCKNEGNVNITLGLLKSKQWDKSGELSLWFAPIDLSIKQGVADIERTEILLADTFDICTWGKVDLVKDYIDMILGLTAQTLNKAFGVKNLPENYVLTLPMRGPSNNVQINTDKATTKVALLLAWQTQSATGLGGNTGALVGGLLGKIATLPDSDAKVPPAKHPFPWENGKARKTSDNTPHEKKKQFKTRDKPLKQILKVIR